MDWLKRTLSDAWVYYLTHCVVEPEVSAWLYLEKVQPDVTEEEKEHLREHLIEFQHEFWKEACEQGHVELEVVCPGCGDELEVYVRTDELEREGAYECPSCSALVELTFHPGSGGFVVTL
jgi:DNA-directed RNA polymerase subunit RPC12/RpoP